MTHAVAAKRRLPVARGRKMTSVELPPALLKAARLHAAKHGITLRALIEQALRDRIAKEDT
jgi:predicted HicB family RNase H-like nuclease